MFLCWRNLFEILKGRGGPGVAGPAAGGAQVDASQQRGEIGGGHLDAAVDGGRDAEGPALKPLDVGITMPSFLWRYTTSGHPGTVGHNRTVSTAIGRDGSWG